MELLLNLIWVVLAVSALYAWSRRRNHPQSRPHLIALICLLALLFPVISATDDLNAMRSEMEDSSPSKRSLKQAATGKTAWQQTIHNPPALPLSAFVVMPQGEIFRVVITTRPLRLSRLSRAVPSDRAPPLPELL
jgi:beta-lactamase regulating signal transducer with metallopeptidase domain